MSLSRRRTFVVQKHKANRAGLHYDFRLELPKRDKGKKVLVSWTVRKGPSLDPTVKRLAIRTQDHDVSYGTFEGTTKEGEYGAGNTIIWDKGSYKILTRGIKTAEDLNRVRYFEFALFGKKLRGVFVMVKTKKGWLLKKKNDKYADSSIDVVKDAPRSVISGKRVEDF